jgi:hypothetical protein
MSDKRLINQIDADYKEDIRHHNSTLVPSHIDNHIFYAGYFSLDPSP